MLFEFCLRCCGEKEPNFKDHQLSVREDDNTAPLGATWESIYLVVVVREAFYKYTLESSQIFW